MFKYRNLGIDFLFSGFVVLFFCFGLVRVFFGDKSISQVADAGNYIHSPFSLSSDLILAFMMIATLVIFLFIVSSSSAAQKRNNKYNELIVGDFISPKTNKEIQIVKIIKNIAKNQVKQIESKIPNDLKDELNKLLLSVHWTQSISKNTVFGCYCNYPNPSICLFAKAIIKPHGLDKKCLNKFIHDLILHEFGHHFGKSDEELIKYKFIQ
jgi:predicted Zn-dependent protease with MMP-like domain